ncbi:MAG: ABC transporter permease subunit [Planctomycetes bacterium]|nr:ABC transporter permease subunit [Planctomycetota bacterium]
MIAGKTWREVRGMGLAYCLLLELLLVPAVLLWPDVKLGLSAIMKMMPMAILRDMFVQMTDSNEEVAYRAYLSVQVFFKGVNIVGIAAAVLLGTGLIARERENQTLEFLVSRPISRSRILWSKFWVTALVVVVPIFVTSWTVIPLSRVPSVDFEISLESILICSVHASVFTVAVLTVTLLCSVLARSQVVSAFWIGAFVIFQATIYFVQGIRVVSVFQLADFYVYGPVMAGNVSAGSLFLGKTIWVALFAAACYATADRAFRRVGL